MKSHHGRRSRIPATAGAVLGIALVVAAIAYAVKPGATPRDAGRAVGYAPPPPVNRVRMLIVGDSFTAGTGTTSIDKSYPYVLARAFDWDVTVDAVGGSGFLNPGPKGDGGPAIKRLPADASNLSCVGVDIVVVDDGRNDGISPPHKVAAAETRYLSAVRKAFPHAKLVVILPRYIDPGGDPPGDQFDPAVAAAARSAHPDLLIDPVKDGWWNTANIPGFESSDHIHPNDAGAKHIANFLVHDFTRGGLSTLKPVDPVRSSC